VKLKPGRSERKSTVWIQIVEAADGRLFSEMSEARAMNI
jgi:hypothetical protein